MHGWNNKRLEVSELQIDMEEPHDRHVILVADPSDMICPANVGFHVDLQSGDLMSMDNPKFHRSQCVGRGCAAYMESYVKKDGNTISIWKCSYLMWPAWSVHRHPYSEDTD